MDFDNIYGKNSALHFFNFLAGLNNRLRTTLFIESRNLYFFYDADNIIEKGSDKQIYIKTN